MYCRSSAAELELALQLLPSRENHITDSYSPHTRRLPAARCCSVRPRSTLSGLEGLPGLVLALDGARVVGWQLPSRRLPAAHPRPLRQRCSWHEQDEHGWERGREALAALYVCLRYGRIRLCRPEAAPLSGVSYCCVGY
jgi:hypothetical protein